MRIVGGYGASSTMDDAAQATIDQHADEIAVARAYVERVIGNGARLVRPDGAGIAIDEVVYSLDSHKVTLITTQGGIPQEHLDAAIAKGCRLE